MPLVSLNDGSAKLEVKNFKIISLKRIRALVKDPKISISNVQVFLDFKNVDKLTNNLPEEEFKEENYEDYFQEGIDNETNEFIKKTLDMMLKLDSGKPIDDIEEQIQKINSYIASGAEQLKNRNKKGKQ